MKKTRPSTGAVATAPSQRTGWRHGWLLWLMLLPGAIASPASAQATAPTADPAVWGVYADLAGTRWQRGADTHTFEWITPDQELAQYLQRPEDRYPVALYRIQRGTRAGELLLRETTPGITYRYTGTVQVDGSVQFDRKVLGMRTAFRVVRTADGGLERQWLKFDGDAVSVREDEITRLVPVGGTVGGKTVASSPAPTSTETPAPITAAPVTTSTSDAGGSTTESIGTSGRAQAPLTQNRKWAAFGPLSYFVEAALYDEKEEDLILVTESKGGAGLGITSPDRAPADIALRAVVGTGLMGKPVLVKHSYGIDGFKQGGKLRPDGSIAFTWSGIAVGRLEDVFALTNAGCLKWTQRGRVSGQPESLAERTFCPVNGDAAILAAARRHVARNKRLGLDSDSFHKQVRALEAQARQEEAQEEARKESEGGGWIGAALGAVAGIAAAKTYGGDAEQVASAALMGAAMGSPNSATLSHASATFQQEMAQKDAQQAAADARLAQYREQAEAVERERERQQQLREQERRRQQQAAVANANERQRLLAEQQQAEQAEAERQARARADEQARRQAEQQRVASEQAAAQRQRQAESGRLQALRQAEQNLRSGFSGHATTCAGGGKDVLYLQSSHPSKTGCNVSFEARCPGTPPGAGIRFSQANYVGGSCMGLGDNIRIGTMACSAGQVRVELTRADCGSGS